MAGTTNKLSLYLPGGGLSGLITPDEQVDIDKINDNMKKIDAAIGFVVCTSGTRPSTPFTGQSIIETDTRNTMYWNGSRWVPLDTLPNASNQTIRDALYPAPVAGNQIFRTDIGLSGTVQEYNGTGWKNQSSGLIPIAIPTVLGVGNSKSGDGEMVIGGSTSLGMGNFATSEFDNYRLMVNMNTSAGSQPILQLLDSANNPYSAAQHGMSLLYNSGNTPVAAQQVTQNYFQLAGAAGLSHRIVVDIFNLGIAGNEKAVMSQCVSGTGAGPYTNTSAAGGNSNVLALAGLFLTTAGGQVMYGRARVYGWNNAK